MRCNPAASPDDERLTSAQPARHAGTLTFWGVRPAHVAARICALAGSPVTRPEWSQYIQGAPYAPPCR